MYMSWSSYLSGDLEGALRYTRLVLEDEPYNKGAQDNAVMYSYYVDNNIPCNNPETGEKLMLPCTVVPQFISHINWVWQFLGPVSTRSQLGYMITCLLILSVSTEKVPHK